MHVDIWKIVFRKRNKKLPLWANYTESSQLRFHQLIISIETIVIDRPPLFPCRVERNEFNPPSPSTYVATKVAQGLEFNERENCSFCLHLFHPANLISSIHSAEFISRIIRDKLLRFDRLVINSHRPSPDTQKSSRLFKWAGEDPGFVNVNSVRSNSV